MEPKVQDTRWQILLCLKKSMGMTVSQLADTLGLSSMGVRQHLAILGRDNMVRYDWERRDRGRPRYVYKITETADELFTKHYLLTSIEILDAIHDLYNDEGVEQVLRKRMERRMEEYLSQLTGETLDEKVIKLTSIRDAQGYLSEFEETEDFFMLKEYSCPNVQIATRYPQVCEYEEELLSNLLKAEIVRECTVKNGSHFGVYRILKY
ncbi:MAG: helix-turn-helix transcriptional regulator [Candidatus Poribacteria bacterium]